MTEPRSDEPRTAVGRALLDEFPPDIAEPTYPLKKVILAIEAEAAGRHDPEAVRADEAALARAITANWRMVKAAGHKDGPTPLALARAILARTATASDE